MIGTNQRVPIKKIQNIRMSAILIDDQLYFPTLYPAPTPVPAPTAAPAAAPATTPIGPPTMPTAPPKTLPTMIPVPPPMPILRFLFPEILVKLLVNNVSIFN